MDEKLPPPSPQEQQQLLERDRISRRSFLMNVGLAINGMVGVLLAVPVVAYILGPVMRRREYLTWIDLGDAAKFNPGETKLVSFRNPFTNEWDGETANIPAYVRTEAHGRYTVFAVNCAHLGCPVRWFSESQLFMCPCHGGVYYADGSRASGPPERGLFEYPTKIENGHLFIEAGQMPTLSNSAALRPCSEKSQPTLVKRIAPCPGTDEPTIG
ncbi:QcrA and Rieske domain-containing protein [Terriglobus albidus]|uniref:QcrA and Rieske domain-containing protein n=1 Tax=Terriglobus albidus TaxID=1592106 RepID=UPI0021DF47EC|nr:Rieske 2Fe-2S domain-containing protein [Terriglobus albidus]